MGFNASNFLLSLSDLFVVIIPGFCLLALVVAILRPKMEWFEKMHKTFGAGVWIVVLVSSFVGGHFVSQFGSLGEDWYWKNSADEIAAEYPDMRATAEKLAANLLPDVKIEATNVRRWAAVWLRQKDARFGERIDRIDVERRFFRNMVVVFFIAALAALARAVVFRQKKLSKNMVDISLVLVLSGLCALSTTRYFYESKRFTADIFENFIAANAPAPVSTIKASTMTKISVPGR